MLLALWSAVLGVALCIVYDVFRFFRIGFLRGSVGTFICDIAFCMFATAGMLVLFFNLTNGRIREYAFLFVIFGFLLWRFTAGRVLMLAATAAAGAARALVSKAVLSVRARIYTRIYCKRALRRLRRVGVPAKRKES